MEPLQKEYHVNRIDGKSDGADPDYFILALDNPCKATLAALQAYADAFMLSKMDCMRVGYGSFMKKYDVSSGGKELDGEFFVLKINEHKPYVAEALKAYAKNCLPENPELALDLLKRVCQR